MMSRPCGVASSIFSASIFDTMAVELIASAPPSAKPTCQPKPTRWSASIANDRRDRDLREPEPEHRAPHRLQLRQAELEADREHQEDDAELGEVADVRAVRHPRERVRARRPCRREIAEDRRQPDEPADDDDDDGGAEQDENQLQRLRHRAMRRRPLRCRLSRMRRSNVARPRSVILWSSAAARSGRVERTHERCRPCRSRHGARPDRRRSGARAVARARRARDRSQRDHASSRRGSAPISSPPSS